MAPESTPPSLPVAHDGTSQARRHQPALDPDFVSVDERSPQDLLAFARDYAKTLNYFDSDNQPAGDWSALLPEDLDLDTVVDYMAAPEKFTTLEARLLNRPHFVLFLAFLKLFRLAQERLNTLTHEHLDFYYQQVLGMTRKKAIPDRTHVFVDLASGASQALLPAGTMLTAGRDGLGRDLLYRTDFDVVLNRAAVARLSSLFVHKRITGIREARELHPQPRDAAAILAMLSIALGEPSPGDPLPSCETIDSKGEPVIDSKGEPVKTEVDLDVLRKWKETLQSVPDRLHMKFYELRSLMELKRKRDDKDETAEIKRLKAKAGSPGSALRLTRIKERADHEWDEINRILERAGQRKNGATFQLVIPQSNDFAANLKQALGDLKIPGFDSIVTYDASIVQIEGYFRLSAEKCHMLLNTITKRNPTPKEWDWVYTVLAESYREKIFEGRRQKLKEIREALKESNGGFAGMVDHALGPAPEGSNLSALDRLKEFVEAGDYAFLESLKPKPAYVTDPNGIKVTCTATPASVTIAEAAGAIGFTLAKTAQTRSISIKVGAGGTDARDLLDAWEDWKNQRANDSLGFEIVRAGAGSAKVKAVTNQALKIVPALVDSLDATVDEWKRVDRIVELAQRAHEALPEPVARHVEWLNAYPAADATAVSAAPGIEAPGVVRWKTFGAQPPEAEISPPPPALGWAICSPLLELSQGKRVITLTLGFEADAFKEEEIGDLFKKALPPFLLQVSTQKGWIEPAKAQPICKVDGYNALTAQAGKKESASLKALQLTLSFESDADAIAPLKTDGPHDGAPWPVLRLLLRPIWDKKAKQFIAHYSLFRDLVLARVHLRVDVGDPDGWTDANQPGLSALAIQPGLTALAIQNDETVLDARKPFEPFGASPAVGSRFFLGHAELVHKRLDCLSFRFEWMGVPADLKTYYANYDAVTDGKFTTSVSLVDRGVERALVGEDGKSEKFPLFSDPTKAAAVPRITFKNLPEALAKKNENYQYDRMLKGALGDDILTWDRYLQWRLDEPDFQHQAYPAVSASKSLELAYALQAPAKAGGDPKAEALKYQVNPPYTPKIKSLSVSYRASTEIVMEDYRRGEATDQVLHVHPFGWNEIVCEQGEKASPFAERTATITRYGFLPRYDDEGEFYIGLSGLEPPRSVSLLFQLAEGSADPDVEPVPVRWSYLNDDTWDVLDKGAVLRDTTGGLTSSGIIVFNLPAARPSTRLPGNLTWIRASVARNTQSICDTVAVGAQAVSATFVDAGNDPAHFSRPLPPRSITGPADPLPEIASVRQPFASFDGTMEESDTVFHTRTSERLRHKQRALNRWDYERLVLDRFPMIYKAKCLTQAPDASAGDLGKVVIIVIPDIRNQLPADPFKPKAPAGLIKRIASFLGDKIPPFARVEVRNAHFVAVRVRVGVRFRPGDQGYYRQRLQDELDRFLSPWAYDEGADITIGARIYANSLVEFIDRRSYVDYVAKIRLQSSEDGGDPRPVPEDPEGDYFVTTGRRDGVLVSAREHIIDLIPEIGYQEATFAGINYMTIGFDFIIA